MPKSINLIIETFPLYPHLETAGEIAITLKKKKEVVYFFWAGNNLPFVDWQLPFYKKIIGLNFESKIKKFIKILKLNDIIIIEDFNLSDKLIKKIKIWADNFYGSLQDLKNYKYHEAILGNSVASSLISLRHEKNFLPKKNIALVRRCLISSAIVYEKSKIIINKTKPKSLYTFNNRFLLSRPIIEAAKFIKVNRILRHERGADMNKYELFEEDIHDYNYRYKLMMKYWRLAPKKNKYVVANNFFKNQKYNFEKYFLTKSSNKTGLINIFCNKAEKKIVFFTSTDYEYEAWTSYVNKKKYYFKNQLQALKIVIDIVKKLKNYILVIRCHPAKILNNFEKIDEQKILKMGDNKKVFVLKSNSDVNSYQLIDKCDIVITFGSTIGIEAYYWRKPSISLRENSYTKLNIIEHPKNKKALEKYLRKKKLKLKAKQLCLPVGYFLMRHGKKFKYFKSSGNNEGKLMGVNLTHRGKVANILLNLRKYL